MVRHDLTLRCDPSVNWSRERRPGIPEISYQQTMLTLELVAMRPPDTATMINM